MGFYHPSTLVKDAQRRGVRFQPIDVQISNWDCTVEPDGAIRLGLRYVNGLRQEVGKKIASACSLQRGASASGVGVGPHVSKDIWPDEGVARCPKCGCDDPSMIERSEARGPKPEAFFCNNCSHDWLAETPTPFTRSREATLEAEGERSRASERGWAPARTKNRLSASADRRFPTLDDLIARTGLRRDEVVTLADIGALNSFGFDRRSALWQAERAVRPSGELFTDSAASPQPLASSPCPLEPMTEAERLVADYAGMGLSIGRHPMALRREELAMRGVLDRRVRVAGMVITRQRPGTAKGFVFLTLEDETGIVNIIVRPDLFARDRLVIVNEPFLIVDGILQNQEGVTSIRAETVQSLRGVDVDFDAHDFY